MTKFTVVTITYNAESVLQRTLNSVLTQTYEDVEHLIIDGASTDGTLSMAEGYKAKSDASAAFSASEGSNPRHLRPLFRMSLAPSAMA